jgi:2-polyprenyl-3-methyl-5-hydroxy-6-metoxy-1,4-benzoquinol methylase
MIQTLEIVENRRNSYATPSTEDSFIVNLLRNGIETILATQPAPLNGRALDIGCGSQPFRDRLESLGYTYVSFDLEQNVEQSVDYLGAINQSLPTQLCQAAPFDFILCTEVMEHVADWQTSFSNFAKLLAPGGKLLITCPHFYPLHEEPYDFWRPTPYEIEQFADQVGLTLLQHQKAGTAWDVLGTLLAFSWTFPTSTRWRDRLITKLVSLSRIWILKQLQTQFFQTHVKLNSPFYVANIALIQKTSLSQDWGSS